jgi:hypothetical protein
MTYRTAVDQVPVRTFLGRIRAALPAMLLLVLVAVPTLGTDGPTTDGAPGAPVTSTASGYRGGDDSNPLSEWPW